MGTVRIVTDCYSSIPPKEAERLGVALLPMPFSLDGEEYVEDVTMTRADFFRRLAAGAEVSTSQPSPADVMDLWDRELKTADEILYIPLSSGLSGSCGVARMLAQDEPYDRRVHVCDLGRIATPLYRSILDARELLSKGLTAIETKEALERSRADMSIYIAVNTLEYLKKGGRVSAAAAAVGTLLDLKPILSLNVGVLDSYKNVIHMKAARAAMIGALRRDLETRFRPWAERGAVHLLASGSSDDETTAGWLREIEEAFPGMPVQYAPLSLGVCCHTGEGALGIGCSCAPY